MAKKVGSKTKTRKSAKKAKSKTVTKAAKKKVAKKPAAKKTVKKAATKKVARKTVKKAAKKPAAKKKAVKAVAAVKAPSRRKFKSTLTKAELKKFRLMLLTKRQDLMGDMSGMEAVALRTNRQGDSGDLSSVPTHPADIGSDNFEQEFTLGLLESERALLDEIDAALGRIEVKTFGICLGTGEMIPKPRLQARPWSKYCIDYARKLEKGLIRSNEDREVSIANGEEVDFED